MRPFEGSAPTRWSAVRPCRKHRNWSESVISLQGVWKIFGTRVGEAMRAIAGDGLTKAQVLERFGCVVGIADCSFEVPRGEIFCVMGLSGSGKSTMVRHINRLIEPTSGRVEVLGRDVLALGEGRVEKTARLPDRHGVPAHGAVSAPHGPRQCRLPAAGAGPAEGGRAGKSPSAASALSVSTGTRTGFRTNCRAACSSGSGSRAPSPRTPRFC